MSSLTVAIVYTAVPDAMSLRFMIIAHRILGSRQPPFYARSHGILRKKLGNFSNDRALLHDAEYDLP
jgi:hypothetical protein